MTDQVSRRRLFVAGASALGALAAASGAQARALGRRDVEGAEALAGVANSRRERDQMLRTLTGQLEVVRALRAIEKPNALQPAQVFDPQLPGIVYAEQSRSLTTGPVDAGALPNDAESLAFAPVWKLSHWLQARQITSRALTELYLARIERHAPTLQCFITVTADRARAEADAADSELAAGRARGPLHGVPYGLKDLFDVEGVPTTWGAEPYANRGPAMSDSIVARRLREAGAVLLGKTTTGAIAYGDIWHNGVTKNPWNVEEGSSGSSAGSASATAAGLIGFGIGTETLGSIVSPSHRCGTTGLRPTFGRIPRTGAMALCWSLDKVGPICRDVLDTALVLSVLNGSDPSDAGSLDAGFAYDGASDVRGMRVGYDPAWFEEAEPHDRAALEAARALGVTLIETRVPEQPGDVLVQGLLSEAAAAFEELTLSNADDQLDWQDDEAWPNTFRTARFISAVDYIQIDRVRRRVMQDMHQAFTGIDALMGPNYAGGMLTITNFTGHPQLAYRAGFANVAARGLDDQAAANATPRRVPMASSLWAPLFEERALIRLGRALERELGVHEERPSLA